MVKFNELMVTPYNKGIYLDVKVLDMPCFNDVYIDEVLIDTQDKFSVNGVSATPVYRSKPINGNEKTLRLFIDEKEIATDMKNKIFFVYVKTKGPMSSDTPCGLDKRYTLGACADLTNIHRKNILGMKNIKDTCTVPRDFINYLLLYKAFQMSFKSREYDIAIEYWKELVGEFNNETKKCPCNEGIIA